ncbi:MAG: tRNA-dihydrouridine synthase [Patescibacteria group bacterium]|nr:tRNA-dihydrouridine synthase [Patescibacteria group bacterium]
MSTKKTFWSKLPRPFFVLAPMANVTDSVFRSLFARYGRPDVTWTEFVSADGLSSPEGRKRLRHDLDFSPKERPIVAQLFTGHPGAMKTAAALAARLGFDGLDINMGCPDRAVEKQGGGSAMIKDPRNAVAVIEAARAGFGGPVSVKTRLGYNALDMAWLALLLEQRPPALTVHLRTRKEMSDVPAHWELMPDIVELRDRIQAGVPKAERTLVIGNGDVVSIEEAAAKARATGCDGVMIGRGIFGKPWFFEKVARRRRALADADPKAPAERLKVMLEHARLFDKAYCGRKRLKNFAVMKKHFKAYVSGWDGAKELRAELMETEDVRQVEAVVERCLKSGILTP